jgi:hypothetical protein
MNAYNIVQNLWSWLKKGYKFDYNVKLDAKINKINIIIRIFGFNINI